MRVKIPDIFCIILIISSALYFITRVKYLFFFMSIVLIVYLLLVTLPNKWVQLRINIKAYHIGIVSLAVLYLLLCFFNFRGASYDGNNLYLRNVLNLSGDFTLTYLQFPLRPYLAEIFLSFIFKYSSVQLLNLSFGVIALMSLFSTVVLYKKLQVNARISRFCIFIIITSPVFLWLGLVEFKTDLFLLFFANISYLLFIKALESRAVLYALLFGGYLAICVLIKLTFAPIAIILLAIYVIDLVFQKTKIISIVANSSVLLFTFLLPLLTWIYANGLFLSETVYYIPTTHPTITLERNSEIYAECIKEFQSRDAGYYYPTSNAVSQLTHVLSYILNRSSDYGKELTMSYIESGSSIWHPGLVIFLGLTFIPIVVLFKKRFSLSKYESYFYILTVIYAGFFFVFLKSMYWYYLPLFSFIALAVGRFIDSCLLIKLKIWSKVLVISLGIFYLLVIGTYSCIYSINTANNLKLELFKNKPGYTFFFLSELLEKNLYTNELVLNASEHKYFLFFPYLKDYDKRVLESKYYFASSNKSLPQMYEELKAKNIALIVTNTPKLYDSWYRGCTRKNNDLLGEFLSLYTTPINNILIDGMPVVYKLKR